MPIDEALPRYAASDPSEDAIPGPSTLRDTPSAYATPSLHESPLYNSSIDPLVMQPTIDQSYLRLIRAPPPDSPVCIGHGLDVPAIGVLSTLVLPTAIGLVIWLLFAILRPRFRQVYGLREWFPPQGLRSKPLGPSLWGFLCLDAPIVSSIPEGVISAGKSPARDAELFPSDEELSKRTLWTSIQVVAIWSFVGLGGLLPLYMAATPCIASSTLPFAYRGQYSTLQDLSLIRLLQLLDDTTGGFSIAPYVRIRLIILTIFAIVLTLTPALWLLMREFNKLVAYRECWVNVRCQGVELGWLSARHAPGLVGWGEKRVKEFVVKAGLSSTLEVDNGDGNGNGKRRNRRRNTAGWSEAEKGQLDVDIQSLFSIGDTTQLALLIDERDEILENWRSLKRITNMGQNRRKRRRGRNPAFGSSSLPPTSYVMPSQYYKLRGVSGISGGQFTDVDQGVPSPDRGPSLTDSFNQRVVGSRFQEVNSSNPTIGLIPMGSQVAVNRDGNLEAVRTPETATLDQQWGGDRHSSWDTSGFNDATSPYAQLLPHTSQDHMLSESEDDWYDVLEQDPEAFDNAEEYPKSSRRRPRPPRQTGVELQRESFPLRNREAKTGEDVPPPHLRLQPRQPFVRPQSGVDHGALSAIYADINQWRTKLKAINLEISEVQTESYNDIADGARIKGWLMIGRGLRYIPGIQLIEGRAKEDIRWDELQNEGSTMRSVGFWTAVVTFAIILAVILTPVAALFLSTAPDFAHYFPFLMRLNEGQQFGAGIATDLVPALLVVLFIAVILKIVTYIGQLFPSVSLSGSQLLMFKTVFYVLTVVGGIALFTAGAVLFAMHSWSIDIGDSASVADGIIYMSMLALLLLLAVAVVFPGLLLLQPIRLIRVVRHEREAITSRQRFRAVYPTTYNPTYALSCCVLAFAYAAAFTLLFPLVAPAALLLLLLTLIAHRFLIGHVHGRTHSSTGGLLQIWLVRRLGTLLAFQPLILGLIPLEQRSLDEGGILCGFAVFTSIFVESYTAWRTRLPGPRSLSLSPRFVGDLRAYCTPGKRGVAEEESLSLVSSARNTGCASSLAIGNEGTRPAADGDARRPDRHGACCRTHPDAPPHLPALPFADHAEEMAGVLYAPELLAPPPVIWLPNDAGGVGRSEAYDLMRYHHLQVTLDVRRKRTSSSIDGLVLADTPHQDRS
ncbi:uncharacterized protein B0H18DRAFT_950236 [Fomitopsis serialis]|uniref:uncharacterized protein n=1 Tax=Fomitopsis serialis TaxID=139415 RepID=UPI002007CAD2|nr:uncharacterized protein B0H18DRAFT_950236 [Neoantrodia serialis]KAH9937349.1 hypothetical protein B0H18DRAFT_950236 [Neoantrodia serialis]